MLGKRIEVQRRWGGLALEVLQVPGDEGAIIAATRQDPIVRSRLQVSDRAEMLIQCLRYFFALSQVPDIDAIGVVSRK